MRHFLREKPLGRGWPKTPFSLPATQAIINVDRSLLICDQAVLLPSSLTPNLLLPVWTVIVRYIAIIKDR